jgi:hypothetical protein
MMHTVCKAPSDQVSMHKFNSLIDLIGHYPILRRGQFKDTTDLFKIFSSKKNKLKSDYTLKYSAAPNGI